MDEGTCAHVSQVQVVTPSADGCEDCMRTGDWWVHLRLCMVCGHVGCCDDSPNRHATTHAHDASHPIIRSFEPGEEWGWCFIDEMLLTLDWPVNGPVAHDQHADETNMRNYERTHPA